MKRFLISIAFDSVQWRRFVCRRQHGREIDQAFDSCFAVEPDTANDTQQSVEKGERVKISPPPTIADGLRVQTPGKLTFPVTRANAEEILTVTDDEIIAAMKFMLFRMKVLVEPSGAAAAAAVLARKLPEDCRRVGVVLSGGNVDSDLLSRLLQEEEMMLVCFCLTSRPSR